MKKRKIISAAAAVMMAAVTLAPQLPSAFPAARICTPITAEAAKNEVRIKVVDMATDIPIENVDAAASTVKDFSREDSSFSWNTSLSKALTTMTGTLSCTTSPRSTIITLSTP